MSWQDRFAKPGAGDPQPDRVACEWLFQRCPSLAEALCGTQGLNGTAKVPRCTLMLFVESGKLKACLKPSEGGQVAFVSISGTEDVLAALEDAFEGDHWDWRKSNGSGRR